MRYTTAALGLSLVLALACGRKHEGDDVGECSDQADNDRDDLFDCEDPDCDGSPACRDIEIDTEDPDPWVDTDPVSDSDDTDTGTDTGTDTDTDTDTDTAPPVVYSDPFWFSFTGFFAHDAATNEIVTYQVGGTNPVEQPPGLLIDLFANSNGQPASPAICSLYIEEPGGFAATTSLGGSSVLFGFEFDWNSATLDQSDCDGKLDPNLWPSDMKTAFQSNAVTFGLAVTGELDTTSDLYAALHGYVYDASATPEPWADEWEGRVLGAAPYLSIAGLLKIAGDDIYFSRGLDLDEVSTPPMIQSGVKPLLAADVVAGTASGAFPVQTVYALNFGRTLDQIFFP